jgi:hypothetical protein
VFTLDRTVDGVSLSAMIESQRKLLERTLSESEARIRRIFRAGEILASVGITGKLHEWSTWELRLGTIPREQLPLLRRALGPIRVAGKTVLDAKRRLVSIGIDFRDHPEVSASYEKTLPRKPKGADEPRCKIVKRTFTTHDIVCKL